MLAWWHALPHHKARGIFLELGANVGACTIEMLVRTNATVVAFEPNPSNLFYLQSSLLRLAPQLQARVRVYPLGIGNTAAQLTIYEEHRNAGSSQIGNPKWGGRKRTVQVERLDDVFPRGLHHIQLQPFRRE